MKVLSVLSLALVVTFLALNKETVEGARILGLFPFHSKSHWAMMEQLAINLAKRGHQIDVVTHFPQKKSIPNYNEISISGSLEKTVNNITAKEIKLFSGFNPKILVTLAGTRICELLHLPQLQNLIKNPPTDPPYDLVILELFLDPCFLAFGRYLKVPVIGVMTNSFDWFNNYLGIPMNTAMVPNTFSAFNQQMTFTERLINTVQIYTFSFLIQYYSEDQVKYVKENFNMDHPVKEYFKEIALLLVNSHYSLTGVRPSMPGMVDIAGIHINDLNEPLQPDVQKWLDESVHGCIYFTFGSMVKIESYPNETVKIFYESFKKLSPTRVLMKVAKKEDLLPGLPENVMVKPWFQQLPVLKHKNVKAYITHGGHMSTQESLYCGVPMVGIPLFGDQGANLAIYEKKKVAISLKSIDQVTEESLTNALKTVLNDPIYKSSIKRLSELYKDRPMKPSETAMYWIEYILRNGKILQSPAINLYWWQIQLLDVWGTILVSIITVLYILMRLLRMLKNCVYPCKTSCKQKSGATKAKKTN